MTQEDKVYEYMRMKGAICQWEANKIGVLRLSSVICNMKKGGLHICSERRRHQNADGSYSYLAYYWLGTRSKNGR